MFSLLCFVKLRLLLLRKISRTLIAFTLPLLIVGCETQPLAFKWAEDEGAFKKAGLTTGDAMIVRNCEIWPVGNGNFVFGGKLTIDPNSGYEHACFVTKDRRLIVVSPRHGRVRFDFKLDSTLRWFDYRRFQTTANGFWFQRGDDAKSSVFIRLKNSSEDGQTTANETVFNYLTRTAALKPAFEPPFNLEILHVQNNFLFPKEEEQWQKKKRK
jgi:hypothetical protein